MISLLFLTFSLINFGQAGNPCTFDFKKDTPTTNKPVYLKKTRAGLVIERPELLDLAGKVRKIQFESYKEMDEYSTLLVRCPGEGNSPWSAITNKRYHLDLEIPCVDGSFNFRNKVHLKYLACSKPVTLRFELRGLKEENFCDKFEGSKAAHLVYELIKADGVTEVVPRVCLDETTYQPLFTFHRIQKEHLSSGRMEMLGQLLRSIMRVDRFVEHPMVPEQELFRFPGIKVNKTDLYGLTVPMIPSISRNNMAKVENYIRSQARKNEDQFTEVFTVSIDLEGVEKLYVTKNKNAGRWLPLIVAKIIKTKEFCLGLLVVNRLERVSEAESICKSECEKHSLIFDENPSSGLVLCCPYSFISRYIPEDLQRTYLNQCNS